MKLRFFILSIGLLLLLSATALGQSLPRTITGKQDRYGKTYFIRVSTEDLLNTPSWNPEMDDVVPLSIRKAIEIARTNLKRLIPVDTDKWTVDIVQLKDMEKDKWLYRIEFICLFDICESSTVRFGIYVKMDGTIVEPTITPNDKAK